MRKYVWIGVLVGIVVSLVGLWYSGNTAYNSPSLLSQGLSSLGQLIGVVEATEGETTDDVVATKQQKTKVRTIPKEIFQAAEPVKHKSTKDEFGPPAVKEPDEWIQVEGYEPKIEGIRPDLARGIMNHLIPKDIPYRPELSGKEAKQSLAKVVLTELPVNGPPRSRRVEISENVKLKPFPGITINDPSESSSDGTAPKMPYVDTIPVQTKSSDTVRPRRIRPQQKVQPRSMPYAK